MPYLRPNGEIDENSAVRGVSVFRYEAVKDTIFKFKYDGYTLEVFYFKNFFHMAPTFSDEDPEHPANRRPSS